MSNSGSSHNLRFSGFWRHGQALHPHDDEGVGRRAGALPQRVIKVHLPCFDRLAEVLQDEFEADVLNISLYDWEIQGGDRTPIFLP